MVSAIVYIVAVVALMLIWLFWIEFGYSFKSSGKTISQPVRRARSKIRDKRFGEGEVLGYEKQGPDEFDLHIELGSPISPRRIKVPYSTGEIIPYDLLQVLAGDDSPLFEYIGKDNNPYVFKESTKQAEERAFARDSEIMKQKKDVSRESRKVVELATELKRAEKPEEKKEHD